MPERIPQTCPACGDKFTASRMKTKCPQCGVLTELGIDGKAMYAFVAPKPANGTAFSVTDLLKEFTAPHITGPGTSDYRGLITILKTVSINDICPVSGMTPLIWAIENGSMVAYCFAHGANPSTRGAGDYDISPLELAIRKGDNNLVDDLVRHGAEAPPEVLNSIRAEHEAEAGELRARSKFVADTIKRFKRDSKCKDYQDHVKHLESILGVSSSAARGRGMRAFAKTPLRALAKTNNADELDYLASLHEVSLRIGYTLFSERLPGGSKVARLLLAPSIRMNDVVAISNLMSPDYAGFERLTVGTDLTKLNATYPFLLLACGRDGVTGMFQRIPEDTSDLAQRLLEICPHYGSDLQAGHGKPWGNANDLTAVQNELNDSGCFHFSWD